jgi:hypothetical protein
MYSPRSVSIGATPFAFEASLRPISSAIIDLPLVTVRAPPAADAEDRLARLLGVRAQCTWPPAAVTLRLVAFEVEIEVGQHVVLDVARLVAQRLEFRQAGDGAARLARRSPCALAERALQVRRRPAPRWAFSLNCGLVDWIAITLCPALLRRGCSDRGRPCRPAPRPRGAPSPSPSRFSLPAMFIRQPRSPASSVSAPVAATSGPCHRPCGRRSRVLHAEGAAEAAAGLRVGISTSVSPRPAEQRRGCALTPSSRRPEQES